MGFLDDMVAVANSVTQDLGLQATVLYRAFVSADGAGKRTYQPPESMPAEAVNAIVIKKQQLVKAADGQLVMSQARVVFLSPRVIREFDQITLPDGTSGPILNTGGFVAETNPILTEVYLG